MSTAKGSKKAKRSKGGKGKKGRGPKGSKEPDVETSGVNVALWELRLKTINHDLAEYRKSSFNLARANDELTKQLFREEVSSVMNTGYWWKEVEAKEDEIYVLAENLKRQAELALEEKSNLVREIDLIQEDMGIMKEREAQMGQMISRIRESKEIADLKYRQSGAKLGEKFLKEKTCLENEKRERYDQQKALMKLKHSNAIEKLKLFSEMELHRLDEALASTINQDLEEFTHSVTEEKISLAQSKKTLELTVKKNEAKIKVINGTLSELNDNLASMEDDLKLKAGILEQMRKKEEMDQIIMQASKTELNRLKKHLLMQEEEMQKVKQMVSSIVKMTKEPEKFFHEALEHVKKRIAANKLRSPFPDGEVQLTWEQKEQVLELLFAKMNEERERKIQELASCTSSKMQKSVINTNVAEIREELCPATISPQAPGTILPSTPNSRPDEHTT